MSTDTALKPAIDTQEIGKFWSDQYKNRGHIWGDDPSQSALILADLLDNNANILELGFGYGRDMVALLSQGFRVTGVEISLEGLREATNQLQRFIKEGHAHIQLGDFSRAQLAQDAFDGVLSHRVLHLLGNNGLVRSFAKVASNVLREDGLLVLSARSDQDFNPEQMRWVDEEARHAEYTIEGREGHGITFWSEKMLRDVFSKRFAIESIVETSEPESRDNKVDTHLLMMVARRKPFSSPSLGIAGEK